MDCVNVFVRYNTDSYGILVPIDCNYVDLVELISAELRLNGMKQGLRIEYDAGEDMNAVMINSDNSLRFYIDLKRKDPRITAFALRVGVQSVPANELCGSFPYETMGSFEMVDIPAPAVTSLVLKQTQSAFTSPQEFASSMQFTEVALDDDDEVDENGGVVTEIGLECIAENQIFKDKSLLKSTIAFYSIRNQFQYKVYKSDHREYVLKCVSESCNWKFRASRLGKTELFKVRYIRHGHSCHMETVIRDHRQANSSLIGDCIKHKYTSARTIYTPIDIMHDMSTTYGLTVRYGKAWRAREHALEKVMGNLDDAYSRLPSYLLEIEKINPGSKTGIEIDGDGHFRYAFMTLGASIQGWIHCKPVVIVDGTFMTGRYGGTLFTACAQDANNSIFILSFGVGDSENNDSWTWFLRRFKEAYGDRDDMVIVSDRHPSIEHAVHEVYAGVMHGFCVHHILQNLRSAYGNSGKDIARPFNAAARAYTKHEFDYHLQQLDQINVGIRKDLEKIGFHHWSRAQATRNKFSAMTSNIVESVNSVTKSVKHCPIDYLFESLRHIVQTWCSKNRSSAQGTFTRLAGKQEKLLRSNVKRSLKLKVSSSNDFLYQVSDENKQHIVDMMEMKCTCNRFQFNGVPCPHGLAVIGEKGDQPYKYCSRYHTKETYVDTYAGCIVPLGDRSQWKVGNHRNEVVIFPPKSKRQPGRPRKTRRKTRLESLNPTMCGRCGEKGHNRRSCKQPHPLIQQRKHKRTTDVVATSGE